MRSIWSRPRRCRSWSKGCTGNARVTAFQHHVCMKRHTSDRASLLIVRLWVEADHEMGLRARITQCLDTTTTETSVAVASTADDIYGVVKQWVEDVAGPTRHGTAK